MQSIARLVLLALVAVLMLSSVSARSHHRMSDLEAEEKLQEQAEILMEMSAQTTEALESPAQVNIQANPKTNFMRKRIPQSSLVTARPGKTITLDGVGRPVQAFKASPYTDLYGRVPDATEAFGLHGWGVSPVAPRRVPPSHPKSRLSGAASRLTRTDTRCVVCQYAVQALVANNNGGSSSDASSSSDSSSGSSSGSGSSSFIELSTRASSKLQSLMQTSSRLAAKASVANEFLDGLCQKVPISYRGYCDELNAASTQLAPYMDSNQLPAVTCMQLNFCDAASYIRQEPHLVPIRNPGDV